MLQAFIITLREGVEAALIAGIALTYLAKDRAATICANPSTPRYRVGARVRMETESEWDQKCPSDVSRSPILKWARQARSTISPCLLATNNS